MKIDKAKSTESSIHPLFVLPDFIFVIQFNASCIESPMDCNVVMHFFMKQRYSIWDGLMVMFLKSNSEYLILFNLFCNFRKPLRVC